MNIVLLHVVNSGMAAPRFIGTKFLGGFINGFQSESSCAFLSHLKHSWEPLMEPPNNSVLTNLGAAMPEFTTCKKTIIMDYEKYP